MSGKRSYTIPILLIVITAMAIGLVALYSKVLLDGQSLKTDRGERLASSYNYCLALANTLNNGASELAPSQTAAERLPVKIKIGQVQLMSGECSAALIESGKLSGQTKEQATEAVATALQAVWAKLEPIGDHDGPLTDEEQAAIQLIQAAGSELEETLQAYAVPTGGDRFRQMAAGVDWTAPAQKAVKQLQELAAALK